MARKHIATGLVILIALGIGYVGVMYLLGDRPTAAGFGLPHWGDIDASGYRIKGGRDLVFGLGPLLLLALGHRRPLGWFLLVATLAPLVDAINVGVNGSLVTALSVHGSAAVVVFVTAVLLLTERPEPRAAAGPEAAARPGAGAGKFDASAR